MVFSRILFGPLLAALTVTAPSIVSAGNSYTATCEAIKSQISHPIVFFPPSAEYATAISHWLNSSSQSSACAVLPETTDDLGTVLRILGKARTPFGVRSGGHATNFKFSSTKGVQISLSRFSQVEYDSATSTVHVGSGLIWDDVYAALEPHGVVVAGGRGSGIGVGGLSVGGGYSWKSNQYGLVVDTVVAFDLVLPNGTFTKVTESSNPDLFFGLKGGINNFGIVTSFTLKALPQTLVWGGFILFSPDQVQQVNLATANFNANNVDPKASVVASYLFSNGTLIPTALLFYDAPEVPSRVFDEFLAIKSLTRDISTRSYLSLIKSSSSDAGAAGGSRGVSHTVALTDYSPKLLGVIANETAFWGNKLLSSTKQDGVIIFTVEPFHGLSAHATPSAYPHEKGLSPFDMYLAWTDPEQDEIFINAVKSSAQTIYNAAIAEGQDISIQQGKQIRYPNYALWDTPLEQLYGENVPKLRKLRSQYDKENVMSLTGGFKL